MKLYMSFGEEVKKLQPYEINSQVESMILSVIRDRVANTEIRSLIQERNQLKADIIESCE